MTDQIEKDLIAFRVKHRDDPMQFHRPSILIEVRKHYAKPANQAHADLCLRQMAMTAREIREVQQFGRPLSPSERRGETDPQPPKRGVVR